MSLINKKAKYKYQQNINYLEIHIVYLEELLKQEKEKKIKSGLLMTTFFRDGWSVVLYFLVFGWLLFWVWFAGLG